MKESLARGADLQKMEARISALEDEMQEARRLNRRLAELTDIVQELLLPVAQRDEEKLAASLEKYAARL
jgi:hypothetical protein